jgi:hypothetical protein
MTGYGKWGITIEKATALRDGKAAITAKLVTVSNHAQKHVYR